MKKAHLLTLLIYILCLVAMGVTYSWMSIGQSLETARYIEYDMSDDEVHDLRIQGFNFDATLYIFNETTSEFETLPRNQATLFTSNGFVPGDSVIYELVLTNNSTITQEFRLSLKDIETTYSGSENIFDHFNIMVYRVTGLEDFPELPEINLSSMTNGNLNFYEGFSIPANTTVNIFFSLEFLITATSEFEDCSVTIGRLVIAQI